MFRVAAVPGVRHKRSGFECIRILLVDVGFVNTFVTFFRFDQLGDLRRAVRGEVLLGERAVELSLAHPRFARGILLGARRILGSLPFLPRRRLRGGGGGLLRRLRLLRGARRGHGVRLALVRREHRLLAPLGRVEEIRLAAKEPEVQIQQELDGVLPVRHRRHLLRHLQHHRVEALGVAVAERHASCGGVGARPCADRSARRSPTKAKHGVRSTDALDFSRPGCPRRVLERAGARRRRRRALRGVGDTRRETFDANAYVFGICTPFYTPLYRS